MSDQLPPKRSTPQIKKPAQRPSSFYRFVIADPAREEWDSIRLFLRREWHWVLLALAGIVALVLWVRPLPPGEVQLAVGPENSSMAKLAERFVAPFADKGIELELIYANSGGRTPAELADEDDHIDAALVVGGLFKTDELPRMLSLGSFQYAPLWVFYRNQGLGQWLGQGLGSPASLFESLGQRTLSIGTPDSKTYILFSQLAKLHNIDVGQQPNFQATDTNKAVEQLLAGEIDAVALVDGYESDNIQRLVQNSDIKLFDVSLAPAYQKHLPFMEVVQVPRGSLDVATLNPADPKTLLASTVSLLVDEDLHPAVQQLFLISADELSDSKDTFFAQPDFFPAYVDDRVPLSPIAKRYFEEGKLPLSDRLPYWLASLIDRLWLLVLGLLAVLYPAYRLVPRYRHIRSKTLLTDGYEYIRYVDANLPATDDPQVLQTYVTDLEWLEQHLRGAWVSSDLYRQYFSLRDTVIKTRDKVQAKLASMSQADGG